MSKDRINAKDEVVVINEHGEKAAIEKLDVAVVMDAAQERLQRFREGGKARFPRVSPEVIEEALGGEASPGERGGRHCTGFEENAKPRLRRTAPRTRQRFDVDTAWFKDRLDGAGMSMRTLAKHIGLDVSAVSLMLNGRRKMTVQEAGAIASQLDASVEEVLRRAGVDDLGVRDNLVEIVGWVDADGTVNKGQGKGPTEVKGPGVEGLRGLWVAAGRWAGWVLMYRPARGIPAEAVGALCVIHGRSGRGGQRVAWVDKGWERGEFKVTGLDGTETHERLFEAAPILWTRQ